MKALVFHQHGDLDQVTVADISEPEIGPDEVLLSVQAAALNRLDLWVLAGWPALKLKLPHVMGSDGAGVVAQVGANVTRFQPGDRVAVNPTLWNPDDYFARIGRDNMTDGHSIIGEHVDGFAAEYIALPARNLVKMPDHVSFAEAAAASLVFVTAWHSLIVRGGLQAGETVLIVGAGGGVNTASIQIAKLAGAECIYVVGSDEKKLALARQLGADVTINRQEEDWGKALFKLTNRMGVDVVVDNVGAATYHTSLRALKRGGRLLTVGNTSGAKFEFDNRLIFGKHLSIIGSTMGTHADYEKVMGMVFDGRLRPIIDAIYPLKEGLTALQRLQTGDVMGKLVLAVSREP
ncbi:MAG: zinc-binding dehydrogenase [Chloroflexi bacterium]|nr:zinc-binding dehydrogenase [Ardenticatenaceae bacterium]NOG36954.1 zinc-binding dehydrogenase [Chloroflexota bacterium]GIK54521.1 MAG: alcohol dehydrogenase [Chloroflexota bacterium]